MKDSAEESINFINFNQDSTCVSVGTSEGYKIFNCDPFGKFYSRSINSVGIVEMLYVTSLVAIVGIGELPSMSPRRLKIVNTKKQATICELTFPASILSVKLNKDRVVVVLEEQIYIYETSTMRLLHSLETLPNPIGLVALSPIVENNYLAYPSPRNVDLSEAPQPANSSMVSRAGDVIIFNVKSLQPYCVIEAHKAGLAAIALSSDGLLLATASIKGTIIRVFDIETGAKLFQFRRGTYGTKIYSLSFSRDNKFLTASSATETVHIFKLSDEFQVAQTPKKDETKADDKSDKQNSAKSVVSDDDDDDEGLGLNEDSEEEVDDDDEEDEEVEDSYEKNDLVGPLPSELSSADLRRSSNGSAGSGGDDSKKVVPIIDQTRRSVGRLIRKSSQSLGRRAAETMGIYLPKRVSSVLKPIRHFASLKIPASNGTKSIVAINYLSLKDSNLLPADHRDGALLGNILEVVIVTSNGLFLKYALDGDRGGDCILLSQYSLLEHDKS